MRRRAGEREGDEAEEEMEGEEQEEAHLSAAVGHAVSAARERWPSARRERVVSFPVCGGEAGYTRGLVGIGLG